ncbi:MAG: 3'-5' exonuclease [Anaerolineales bacterium]|nr:3'-5' exonuclease [Anaerolineales bacterium]
MSKIHKSFEACYISVDVETAGPHPNSFALLSIGACMVYDLDRALYLELQPDRPAYDPQALEISGLSLETLAEDGIPAREAMRQFDEWLSVNSPPDEKPVFVAFNAAFDWMFIHDYFHKYLGHNPFGHSALDIKALYMGATGTQWAETSHNAITQQFQLPTHLEHHALQDARDQAMIFRKILELSKHTDNDG